VCTCIPIYSEQLEPILIELIERTYGEPMAASSVVVVAVVVATVVIGLQEVLRLEGCRFQRKSGCVGDVKLEFFVFF